MLVEDFDARLPFEFLPFVQGFIKQTQAGAKMFMDVNSEPSVEITSKVLNALFASWKKEEADVRDTIFNRVEEEIKRLSDISLSHNKTKEDGSYEHAIRVLRSKR